MPEGVLLVGCTEGSDGWCAMLAHALVTFFGDKTCSAQNTNESCFSAEWCDRSLRAAAPATFVVDLMQNNTCHVALDAKSRQFLGVAAVSPEHTLHTFCVVGAARGRGVGSMLMDHVLAVHGARSPLHLTVAAPLSSTATSPAAATLDERHDRLVAFYETCGFRRTVVADGYPHVERPCAKERLTTPFRAAFERGR